MIFLNLSKSEKFDSIFWAMPFGYVKKKNLSLSEKTVFDTEYSSITRFINEASGYLNEDGRLLIGFSTVAGHYGLLQKLLEQQGFKHKIIATTNIKEKRSLSFQIIEARPH